MTIFKRYDLRCPVCLAEFSFKAMANSGIKDCPMCHTILQPLEVKHDGYIRVNWQDMRTLATYASRWSRVFDTKNKGDVDAIIALQNIIEGLSRFRPLGAEPIIPLKDPMRDGDKSIDVRKLAEINTGDNLSGLKPGKDGKIVSPFFRRL